MPPWAIRRVTRKRSARSCPGASGSSARWGCGVPDMMAASIAHYHSTCFLWGLVLRPRDSLRPRQPLTEARGSDSKPEPGAVVIDLSNDPPAEPEAFRLLAPQRGAIATEQKCRAPEHGIVGACSNPPVRKSHRTLLVGALPILPCFTGQQREALADRRTSEVIHLAWKSATTENCPNHRQAPWKLQYTGQSVWPGASCVSNLESNRLAGILAFNRSNLCTRPQPPDSALVRLARAS